MATEQITVEQIEAAQAAWGDGIVRIALTRKRVETTYKLLKTISIRCMRTALGLFFLSLRLQLRSSFDRPSMPHFPTS